MSRTRMIEIDGAKLTRLLEVAGVTPKEASRRLGFAGDYLPDCIRRGRVSTNAAKSLEMAFRVQMEDIVREDEQKEPEPVAETREPEDLKELITEAVLEALKRWKGEEIVAAMEKWREETKG